MFSLRFTHNILRFSLNLMCFHTLLITLTCLLARLIQNSGVIVYVWGWGCSFTSELAKVILTLLAMCIFSLSRFGVRGLCVCVCVRERERERERWGMQERDLSSRLAVASDWPMRKSSNTSSQGNIWFSIRLDKLHMCFSMVYQIIILVYYEKTHFQESSLI